MFEDKGVKVVVDGRKPAISGRYTAGLRKEGLNEGLNSPANVKDECGCGSFHDVTVFRCYTEHSCCRKRQAVNPRALT